MLYVPDRYRRRVIILQRRRDPSDVFDGKSASNNDSFSSLVNLIGMLKANISCVYIYILCRIIRAAAHTRDPGEM